MPAEAAAIFQPAMPANTSARLPGGACRSRVASDAVIHGAVSTPTTANAPSSSAYPEASATSR